jgi:hypothetical protein
MNLFRAFLNLFLLAMLMVPQMANSEEYHKLNYIGVDLVQSYMKFHNDFGGNIFAKSAPGLNLFFGHMCNKNFGFEIGYEAEKKKQRSETILSGNIVAGNLVQVIDGFESYYTTVKKRQPYLGFTAKMPVTNRNFLQLLLGYSLVNVTAKSLLISNNAGSIDETSSYVKTKAVPMLRAAFEHKYTNNFGVKVFAAWRNTKQIKIMSQEKSTTMSFEAKLKNTINIGAGLIYYI